MKILVTGHCGFIGSHMLKHLQHLGHEVSTFEWGDVPLPTVRGLDWVVHIGAVSSTVDRNINRVMMQNYDFSCWLLDECAFNGVNFQWSSSASIYGLTSMFCEDAPPDPRTPYAWSKYMFERYTNRRNYDNILVQGFRYFNVYGPEGEEHKGTQASPHMQFKRQAQETGQIKVFAGSENYRRDFVHVSQVVATHVKFFDIKESDIWNVGTGHATSFLDVAKTFDVPIVEIPMPELLKNNYQEYTCADMTKTWKTLTNNNKKTVDTNNK